MKNYLLKILFLLLLANQVFAQNEKQITLSGFITDEKTGEVLIGTNILLYKDSISSSSSPFRGTASNSYGFYSIPTIPKGKFVLIARHIGYRAFVVELLLDKADVRLNIEMEVEEIKMGEVIVKGEKEEEPEISTINISPEILSKLPSLSGEIDLFKSLQLLPGITTASELSSGLYVRGGSPDQTLTLVDGMIIYNPSHLGNFTTTFNSNALQNVKLIKGGFPAEYGGRLSSVLDIKLRSGTKEKDIGKIGVGVINSHVTLEGPMTKNSTYLISGRGMYYDAFQKSFNKEGTVPRYNFYDVNLKFSYNISESDIVSISGMLSRDNLYSPANSQDLTYDINWENRAFNLNWLQVNSTSFFTNTTFNYISYNFNTILENDAASVTASDYYASSNLQDFILKKDFEYYWHESNKVKAGIELTAHNYDLIASNIYSTFLESSDYYRTNIFNIETSAFLQNQTDISSRLKTNIGGRVYFLNTSKYIGLEPRASASFLLTNNLMVKSAYSVAHQFLHLITRNDISLPTDLWYPSTENIKPSRSQQVVFGIDYDFLDKEYLFSIEGYYRDMNSIYEFKDNAEFDIGNSIEDLLSSGKGEAYGIEFFFNKRKGKLSGWIGYTLSWTKRLFNEINSGRIFYPRYDRRHDISAVLTYEINQSLSFAITWIYATGQGFTLPIGQYQFYNFEDNFNPETRLNYTGRNEYKLPDYHKMDLNITYKFKWFSLPFEVYLNMLNLYNRQNSFAQYIVLQTDPVTQEKKLKLKQITLFPFIPSAGINIEF